MKVERLPRLIAVPIKIGPFDKALDSPFAHTISVYAVENEDKTKKTLVGSTAGLEKDTTYSITADLSTLTDGKMYRFVSYTDNDGGGNRVTLIPNPDTVNPFLFTTYDPDGE